MKRHPFDTLSFVSGLVAVATGVLFLFPGTPGDLVDRITDAGEWLLPTLLIAIGVAVLAPLVARGAQKSEEETEL